MKRSFLPMAILALTAGAPVLAEPPRTVPSGILHRISQDDVAEVDRRLREAIDRRGLRLMTVIDHAENAAGAGLELPETRTFLFGNPAIGTPMMQCAGSLALDLPQKMVVRTTSEGTRLEWNDPHYLADRHGLGDCELPLDKVAGVLAGLAEEAASS
ncbi:DUF302 domain-containing protein [Halomonas beimenensis]|uniref:DUF302 domain-containing protein n=1 Tax=Halomonas beimenensis TaxID=475662 RepID=A0A291PAK4_9GAMM|nr:DUF302 domain-containing protein [Halomonas beimenensis]ATJ83930.1 hypothetical protein BEI_2943 [Halomonas beimenensis]